MSTDIMDAGPPDAAVLNGHADQYAHAELGTTSRDATPGDAPRTATPAAEADHVAERPARNAKPRRTARRGTGHVPGDLPTVLHRHLAAMGPAEAVAALDALHQLTSRASATAGHVDAAWLAVLSTEIDARRDAPGIKRLVAMLVDLVPLIAGADNEAAVDAVLGFARSTSAAALAAATDRQRRRR